MKWLTKIKYENKVNKNKVLSYCDDIFHRRMNVIIGLIGTKL